MKPVSEPLERIKDAGEVEYQRCWKANIWAPITATCLFVAASIIWFFVADDVWYALSYMLAATYAVMLMWGSRFLYASLKAEEAKLDFVLLVLASGTPEDETDDEPEV